MMHTPTRSLPAILGLLLAVTSPAAAQVGRIFVSAEAYAGVSRVVYVGKIVELRPTEYDKPLTSTQEIGKPYRLVFEVAETIRGDKVKRLELVLSLQSTIYLEAMRDHGLEILLAAGPTRLDSYPGAEIGVEEQGKRVDGDWYQFRVLELVDPPESSPAKEIAEQINHSYDQTRMFTSDLKVVVGRKKILKRVRAFAKAHPKMLPAITLRVPNEFGAKVGDPNAYCGITLPLCPETRALLRALKADPGLILRHIDTRFEDYNRRLLTSEVEKLLAELPLDGGN